MMTSGCWVGDSTLHSFPVLIQFGLLTNANELCGCAQYETSNKRTFWQKFQHSQIRCSFQILYYILFQEIKFGYEDLYQSQLAMLASCILQQSFLESFVGVCLGDGMGLGEAGGRRSGGRWGVDQAKRITAKQVTWGTSWEDYDCQTWSINLVQLFSRTFQNYKSFTSLHFSTGKTVK